MKRPSERERALEREVALLRRTLEIVQKDPGDIPFLACGHGCAIATSTGMATNGPCSCNERKLRMAAQWWRRRAVFVQATVQQLRERDDSASLDSMRAALNAYGPHGPGCSPSDATDGSFGQCDAEECCRQLRTILHEVKP